MQLLQNTGRLSVTKASPNRTSLAEWLLRFVRGLRVERQAVEKQMHLLETLPLGGKRQLFLVSCAGERFLIGGGPEGIETIVQVHGRIAPDEAAKKLDGTCI